MRSSVLTASPGSVAWSDSRGLKLATPYAFVALPSVGSTQDEARRRAKDGQPLLVVAERQVAGRGRTGRVWLEAPRAMYASLAMTPQWPSDAWPRLTLVAGLAARTALHDAAGRDIGLKWPNDLVDPEGKLGGILTEAEGDLVVIGCGVNLWWPDAPDGIAAALDADPGPAAAAEVASRWASEILAVAAADPDEWGVAAYRAACVTVGTDIVWDPGGAGRAVAIDAGGGLVVETAHGVITLTSGEVRAVRGATVAPGGDREADG